MCPASDRFGDEDQELFLGFPADTSRPSSPLLLLLPDGSHDLGIDPVQLNYFDDDGADSLQGNDGSGAILDSLDKDAARAPSDQVITSEGDDDDDDDDDEGTVSPNVSGGGTTKRRQPLPVRAVEIMHAWMMSPEHFRYPYPTETEREQLAQQAGEKSQLVLVSLGLLTLRVVERVRRSPQWHFAALIALCLTCLCQASRRSRSSCGSATRGRGCGRPCAESSWVPQKRPSDFQALTTGLGPRPRTRTAPGVSDKHTT